MSQDPMAFASHDHDSCISVALTAADAACAARKVRMTPVRRRVLEILLESHSALGAYDVLARLDAEGLGSKPPVAYRALAFLVEQGFAHRIERLNAFIACMHPGAAHDPAFMICRKCGTVAEAQASSRSLTQAAAANGFQLEQPMIEAEGICPACQPDAAACA